MSHELRTPLNAIIGFSEIIAKEIFGPVGKREYREYARDIHESGGLLLGIIGTFLGKKDEFPQKRVEMEVRSLTGVGVEKTINH